MTNKRADGSRGPLGWWYLTEVMTTHDRIFLSRLREDTKTQHAAIERRVDIKRVCGSRATYAAHLVRLYGFYRPFEDALWCSTILRNSGPGPALDPAQRRKTPALRRDLCALGHDPEHVPLAAAPVLPATGNEGEALGCLYVLEGATLGGRIITGLVRERLGIGPDDGGAFFHGYGEATGAMWEAFRATLTAYAQTEPRQQAVIHAARATFDALNAWLAQCDGAVGAGSKECRP